MLKFRFTPEIAAKSGDAAIVQTIQAFKDNHQVGSAIWFAPLHGDLAQLLSLDVTEKLRRQGIGSQLLLAVYSQAQKLSKSRQEQIKRFWCMVEHERGILGRSFLFKHGYHHVTTPKRLYRGGQDPMIYVKAFD